MTLRTVGRGLTAQIKGDVFVCENPAVRLATNTRPLVCTEGQPSLACQKLLALLERDACRLRYHGDFDWGGIKIANFIFRQHPTAIPWRFKTEDYTELVRGYWRLGAPTSARPCSSAEKGFTKK